MYSAVLLMLTYQIVRRKLNKKSWKVLFVSYEKLNDNYQLYESMTKKVFVSAHVNFSKDNEEENKYLFTLVRVGDIKANDNEDSNEKGSLGDSNENNDEESGMNHQPVNHHLSSIEGN